jgi:hypothetical protein
MLGIAYRLFERVVQILIIGVCKRKVVLQKKAFLFGGISDFPQVFRVGIAAISGGNMQPVNTDIYRIVNQVENTHGLGRDRRTADICRPEPVQMQ